jgi:hypothetical protein
VPEATHLTSAVKAGAAYAGIMFAIGFVPGAARELLLAPSIGALTATLVELPVMLALSWLVCAALVRRHAVAATWPTRVAMGAAALLLLLAAETVLGVVGFGRLLMEQRAAYAEPAAQLGLAAQLAFAAFPLIQLRNSGHELCAR